MNTNAHNFAGKWLTLEKIQNQEYLTTGFHEEFFKIFGFNINEAENLYKEKIKNVNYYLPNSYDKVYIAVLIKNANLYTWKNMEHFKLLKRLNKNILHFKWALEEIIKYFRDENFEEKNFSQEYIEIKKYLANKFPKEKENQTQEIINNSREKISKIQLYFSKK